MLKNGPVISSKQRVLQQQTVQINNLLEKFNLAGSLPLDILKWLNALLKSDPIITPPIDIITANFSRFQKICAGFKKIFDHKKLLRTNSRLIEHPILEMLSLYLSFTIYSHRNLPKYLNLHTNDKLLLLHKLDNIFFSILFDEMVKLNFIHTSEIDLFRQQHHLILQIDACLFEFLLIIFKYQAVPRVALLSNSFKINNHIIYYCKMHVNQENSYRMPGQALNHNERQFNQDFYQHFREGEPFFLRPSKAPSHVRYIDPDTGLNCNFYLGAINDPPVIIDMMYYYHYHLFTNQPHFSQGIKAILFEDRIHLVLNFLPGYQQGIDKIAYFFTIPHVAKFAKCFIVLMNARKQIRNMICEAIKYKNIRHEQIEKLILFDSHIQTFIDKQYLAKLLLKKEWDDHFKPFYDSRGKIDSLTTVIHKNEKQILTYQTEIALKKKNVSDLLETETAPYTRMALLEEQEALQLYEAELGAKIELLRMKNKQFFKEIKDSKLFIASFLQAPFILSLLSKVLPFDEINKLLKATDLLLKATQNLNSSFSSEKNRQLLYNHHRKKNLSSQTPVPKLSPSESKEKTERKKIAKG